MVTYTLVVRVTTPLHTIGDASGCLVLQLCGWCAAASVLHCLLMLWVLAPAACVYGWLCCVACKCIAHVSGCVAGCWAASEYGSWCVGCWCVCLCGYLEGLAIFEWG